MHALNGNGRGKAITIISQNIPGCYGASETESRLHELISRYQPTVLCVNEVRHSILQSINLPEYTLVRGKQLSFQDCRTNLFVKKTVTFESCDICCECPLVSIKIGQVNIISVYREWRVIGRIESDKIENQLLRLQSFLESIEKVKGQSVIIGDMNIDVNVKNGSSAHYISLTPLRDELECEMNTTGYRQLVTKNTRYQKGQRSSLLDHIYYRGNFQLIKRQFNKNILGDDHNMIGLSIYTNIVVLPHVYSVRRNIGKVSELEFETIFNCSLPWEITSEPDVNLSLDCLVEKITWTLDHTCPEIRCQQKVNYQP